MAYSPYEHHGLVLYPSWVGVKFYHLNVLEISEFLKICFKMEYDNYGMSWTTWIDVVIIYMTVSSRSEDGLRFRQRKTSTQTQKLK